MKTWVTKELAAYAVETEFKDYPKKVIDKVKILILDNIGCMLGGCQSNLGRAIVKPIKSMGGNEEATIVGGGAKVPTIQAAFVNGTTANALDYDDQMLGLGHPGSTIISAALAVGEWVHASGKDIINAVLIGYDVCDRIGIAIQPTPEREAQVWGVGTWQTFGAAAAAAKLLNLDLNQTLDAYGVAGATAPLPNTQKWGWDLEERPIHWAKEPTGWPSWTGTTAAILAANGFIGNHYILDGDDGFWIMAGSDQCDFDRMTKGLGSEYEVDNIAIKAYSCCGWQHAALDCIKALKKEHQLQLDDIDNVVIHGVAWLKRQENWDPTDTVDAQFSVPYTAAMVLTGIHPGPAWFTRENLDSEKVSRLSKKVTVRVDPEIDKALYEELTTSARVAITTKAGQRFERFVKIPSGDPRNPPSAEEVKNKFRNQAGYVLTDQEMETVIATIDNLENTGDISDLMSLLG